MRKLPSRALRWLLRRSRGATAVEVAFLATPFLILVFGTIELGYDLFLQADLDSTLEAAARAISTGSVVGTPGETSSQLVSSVICPNEVGQIDCTKITAAVERVPAGKDYYGMAPLTMASAQAGTVCTGTAGSMMLLAAWYAGPTFVAGFLPQFSAVVNGARVHLTASSVGFVDQYFAGGQAAGTGC